MGGGPEAGARIGICWLGSGLTKGSPEDELTDCIIAITSDECWEGYFMVLIGLDESDDVPERRGGDFRGGMRGSLGGTSESGVGS